MCEYAIASEPRSGIAFSFSFDIGRKADAGKDSQAAFGHVKLYLMFQCTEQVKYSWSEKQYGDRFRVTTSCRTVSSCTSRSIP
jgi:hypothetical protein